MREWQDSVNKAIKDSAPKLAEIIKAHNTLMEDAIVIGLIVPFTGTQEEWDALTEGYCECCGQPLLPSPKE